MSFKKSVKIQKAFSIFIVKQMQEKSDFAELKTLFKSIDKNGDGKLSRDELISGMNIIQLIKSIMVPHIQRSKQ